MKRVKSLFPRRVVRFLTLYLLLVLCSTVVIVCMEGVPVVKAAMIALVASLIKTAAASGHAWAFAEAK